MTLRRGLGIRGGWPRGSMGNLHVAAGVTYTLNPGQVYDFMSVTIDATGKIVAAPGSAWVIMGIAGVLTCNGTLISQAVDAETYGGSTVTAIAPDGTHLSYTFPTQSAGGDGGHYAGFPLVKGLAGYGNGGGGGQQGSFPATNGIFSKGGDGGTSEAGFAPQDGIGALIFGGTGNEGVPYDTDNSLGAGGGGGGSRGYSGGAIYLSVNAPIAGSGIITVSGQAGGGGGVGVWSEGGTGGTGYGAGGGGGAGGGNGGKIVLRAHGTPFTGISVVKGIGGSGGAGGNGDNPSLIGTNGVSGSNGTDGVLVTL